jgi:hypothetical protein
MSHICPDKEDPCRDFHTFDKMTAILSCRSCCTAFFRNYVREMLKEASQ